MSVTGAAASCSLLLNSTGTPTASAITSPSTHPTIRSCSVNGSPAAAAASAGDIAYYAPWGNLAIFYRDFPRSAGLMILGRIDGPLDALTRGDGAPTVTIEAAEPTR